MNKLRKNTQTSNIKFAFKCILIFTLIIVSTFLYLSDRQKKEIAFKDQQVHDSVRATVQNLKNNIKTNNSYYLTESTNPNVINAIAYSLEEGETAKFTMSKVSSSEPGGWKIQLATYRCEGEAELQDDLSGILSGMNGEKVKIFYERPVVVKDLDQGVVEIRKIPNTELHTINYSARPMIPQHPTQISNSQSFQYKNGKYMSTGFTDILYNQ
jgi:hypothetical protein